MSGLAEAAIAVVDQQPINVATMPDLVRRIVTFCRSGRGFTLFTLNLDHLVKRRRDARFKAAYARATLVSADGWPVAAIARRQGAPVERVTGADLILPLCEAAARDGIPVFFFGSTDESLAAAAAALRQLYPNLDIRGTLAPPMGFDPTGEAATDMAQAISESGARLCFVALGAPKQELFADFMAARFPSLGFLCIGAALDFVSGRQRRAPRMVQKFKAEWLWRLAGDPRRMVLRYGSCALVFADVLMRLPLNRLS
jgi:exopolysaccharide biosynthesis WecB/TagA/CpsF family protein